MPAHLLSREQLLAECEPFCHKLVGRAIIVSGRSVPQATRDDLLQVARQAVLEAHDRYDARPGRDGRVAAQKSWAWRVIACRVKDAVRTLSRDPVPFTNLTRGSCRSRSLDSEVESGARYAVEPVAEPTDNDVRMRFEEVAPLLTEVLDDRERDVLRLWMNGHSFAEVGAALGVEGKNVRGCVHFIYKRAIGKLAHALAQRRLAAVS